LPIWWREGEGSGIRDGEELERKCGKERREGRRGGGEGELAFPQLVFACLLVPSPLGDRAGKATAGLLFYFILFFLFLLLLFL
jgi:hypothetical protein